MGKSQAIFLRGSRACRHASPFCVDQHLVVRRLRGVARTSSTQLDTTRTYPQVR
jgi:alkylhydroperoxidase family enzyme